jgi:hypothetical protein
MKRLFNLLFVFTLLLFTLGLQPVSANTDEDEVFKKKAEVQLTKAQVQEIEILYKEVFEKKKVIITKYAEYGVITQEQLKKKLARMDKWQAKLKENGYLPECDKKKGNHHGYHEGHGDSE